MILKLQILGKIDIFSKFCLIFPELVRNLLKSDMTSITLLILRLKHKQMI